MSTTALSVPAAAGAKPRVRVPAGRQGSANFTGADLQHQDLAGWVPRRQPSDVALLWEQETLVGRSEDLARNDGWARSGKRRYLDSMVGSGLRLFANVDYKALGLEAAWAREFNRAAEARYRTWSEDPDCFCDAGRRLSIGAMHRLLAGFELEAGEGIAVALWLDRGGPSRTAFQVINPARLGNPWGRPESEEMRGGVELGSQGEPLAYWFAHAHPGDTLAWGARRFDWERVERETWWGRRQVLHSFEALDANQVRGVTPFAPLIKSLKMLGRHDEATLQAAVIDAVLGAYVESPMDPELVAQALGAGKGGALGDYQAGREAFHKASAIRFGQTQLPILFPGEKVNLVASQRPGSNFVPFQEFVLRKIAAGLGVTYEQLSQDWSKVNYSSARAALLEAWKFLAVQRHSFAFNVPQQMYALWLEEELDAGTLPLPANAPDFYAPGAKAAYSRARWIGPARGHVDPEKEAKGQALLYELGSTDLQTICAEQGRDWEEVAEQRLVELQRFKELGLPPPSWARMEGAFPSQPPQREPASPAGGEE